MSTTVETHLKRDESWYEDIRVEPTFTTEEFKRKIIELHIAYTGEAITESKLDSFVNEANKSEGFTKADLLNVSKEISNSLKSDSKGDLIQQVCENVFGTNRTPEHIKGSLSNLDKEKIAPKILFDYLSDPSKDKASLEALITLENKIQASILLNQMGFNNSNLTASILSDITHENSSVITAIQKHKPDFNLSSSKNILVFGQSNAQNFGDEDAKYESMNWVTYLDDDGYKRFFRDTTYLGAANSVYDSETASFPEKKVGDMNLLKSMAEHDHGASVWGRVGDKMSQYDPSTNSINEVTFVIGGRGGTDLKSLLDNKFYNPQTDQKKNVWEQTLNKAKKLGNIDDFIFVQGESDQIIKTSEETYGRYLDKIKEDMASEGMNPKIHMTTTYMDPKNFMGIWNKDNGFPEGFLFANDSINGAKQSFMKSLPKAQQGGMVAYKTGGFSGSNNGARFMDSTAQKDKLNNPFHMNEKQLVEFSNKLANTLK